MYFILAYKKTNIFLTILNKEKNYNITCNNQQQLKLNVSFKVQRKNSFKIIILNLLLNVEINYAVIDIWTQI